MKIGGGSSGGDFPKCDPGQHVAVCAAIYDIGVQHNQRFDSKSARLAIVWELEAQEPGGGPFVLIDDVPMSTNRKSRLCEVASALLARAIEEGEQFDADELIGKPAMLTVAHSAKGNPYIDRRDALQDKTKKLTVQGKYGKTDEIHGLVAWHMRNAEDGTVTKGQGVMPEGKVASAYRATEENSATNSDGSKQTDYGKVPF